MADNPPLKTDNSANQSNINGHPFHTMNPSPTSKDIEDIKEETQKENGYKKRIELYRKMIKEKESILNSYKIFLKTCNFDFQILIQSNKENLDKHISNINL